MKVFVYYNLHKRHWSIKAMEGVYKGRVIAHLTQLAVHRANFKVSEAGRQRVLREKRKNVHAGVVGELGQFECNYDTAVSYNPYKYEHFYRTFDGSAVYTADTVSFNGKLVTCSDK